MDDFVTNIFLGEIKRQCKFAFIAISDMDRYLRGNDVNRFWYSLHSFLSASGNISKIFWPIDKKYCSRGARLRQLLNISSTSSLEHRNLRNLFEHFDEKIEEWANLSANKNIIDCNISSGPITQNFSGSGSESYLRNFDTKNTEVTFTNQTYNLLPLIEEVKVIQNSLDQLK